MSTKSDKLDVVAKREFQNHCKENNQRFDSTDQKLDKLMPLANLAPLLEQMVEEKRAYTIVAAKVVKIIGIIGALVGLLYGVIKIWQEVK